MTQPLPEPTRARWQPLRAGVVDLFYYDNEEFWFRDGRLLLRGNNGTGKSKVLALTLPFLLDGDLSPHRVEPDADPRKRMDWNLLLGGEHPYPERLGYTWLEFGCLDDDGWPSFRTLGCGLKAVTGKGIARHWFFVTSQRSGRDLHLVDATGVALPRDRLADALGDHGEVYDRAARYRRAVDECLFGFGEQRYNALVDLLIQLRQPQLSKRPSEKALSKALTEALPPLDQAVVTDVAEAFRSLEEDRAALRDLIEAESAARSFLDHYRHYARVATRRRAARPRNAQSVYERTTAEMNAAQEAYEQAAARFTAAQQQVEELEQAATKLEAQERALRQSPEMRSARDLEQAADEANRRRQDADRAVADRKKSAEQVEKKQSWHADAVGRLSAAEGDLAAARGLAANHAQAAHLASDHRSAVDSCLDAEPDLSQLRSAAEQLVQRQRRAIGHVRDLIDAVAEAARQLVDARARLDDLTTESDELVGQRIQAEQATRDRGVELVAAIRRHLDTATELRIRDQAAVLAELELWVETLDGHNPVSAATSAAARIAAEQLSRTDAGLAADQQRVEERVEELTAEIDRLERGEDTTPPTSHTRDPATRADRRGAPLWQLVDFADHVTDTDRAGLEAALEAAGILDAWVTPDGELLPTGTDDVIARPGTHAPTGLDSALVAAIDRADPNAAAVSDRTVRDLLASIGLGAGETWVGSDGTFHVGVLDGSWRKPAATYIGRGAREAARRARLAELRDELSGVEVQLAEVRSDREEVDRRRELLDGELAAVPDDGPLRAAHTEVGNIGGQLRRLAGLLDNARTAVESAQAGEERARQELTDAATDTGLPADPTDLRSVDEAVREYGQALAALWPAVSTHSDAMGQAERAAADLHDTEEQLEELTERATGAEQDAAEAEERHQTLRDSVGAAVEELQGRLAAVIGQRKENKSALATANEAKEEAIEERGNANGTRGRLVEELETAAAERNAAAESFRRFASTGLHRIALPDLDFPDPGREWAPDPTVRLARRVNDELADVADDDQASERAQNQVNTELKRLQETLSVQGHSAVADLREDGIVVEVVFRARPTPVPELVEALAAEVTDRQRLLDEREREILENHLVNEVASSLQELIFAAEAQVQAMNTELEERPTSTGMRLRLVWQPRGDGPTGLTEARKRLLRQTADAWHEDDRTAVGSFLQERIAEVQARDSGGTWLEHLTEALDYRAWHEFVIQRHQNGHWRPASGPASGGERVLAASVPLFAAASAHYASAGNSRAPRLVTLDEAFAGVDDTARASYFGLLAAFDLDVAMTSEREWGCYPEVPGLAIAVLSRRDGVPAVLVTNWEWDGVMPRKVDRPVPALSGERAEEAQDGLFG